jgi:hypothetical protein
MPQQGPGILLHKALLGISLVSEAPHAVDKPGYPEQAKTSLQAQQRSRPTRYECEIDPQLLRITYSSQLTRHNS